MAQQNETPTPRRPILLPIIRDIVQGMVAAWPILSDVHPLVVLSSPRPGFDDTGRQGMVVKALVERTRLDGTKFTKVQNILENYIFEAPDGLEMALINPADLAGTLKSHAERQADFLAERQAASSVLDA